MADRADDDKENPSLFEEQKKKKETPNNNNVAKKDEGGLTTSIPLAEPTKKSQRQELFMPVSGFIWLYPEEVEVMDHPVFQRLGRIYQLGHTYMVYRGATHKRFEHAIGSLHIVQRMIDAVNHTSQKNSDEGHASDPLTQEEIRFIRLGALLHDIGHVALGHTIEDELELVEKHDEAKRLNRLFEGNEWLDNHGRTLAQLIDEIYEIYLPKDIRNSAKASLMLRLMIWKPSAEAQPRANKHEKELLKQETEINQDSEGSIRLSICRDMIGNTICADLLDYLHRDWYHIGKPKPMDERILQFMEIRNRAGLVRKKDADYMRSEDRFVIHLGEKPRIRTDAISAILELLEWRYQLAESVLFHRTKLAAAGILDRALYELLEDNDKLDLDDLILNLSDEQFIQECIAMTEQRMTKLKLGSENYIKMGTAQALLKSLRDRDLYTNLTTYHYDDLPSEVRQKIMDTFAGGGQNRANRMNAVRILEEDLKFPSGSIVMYCPTEKMNAKIAKVRISINGQMKKFNIYERENDNRLSGGHLEAQLKRFTRLWRIHFFIDKEVLKDNKNIQFALNEVINKFVLDYFINQKFKEKQRVGLAKLLTTLENSPWNNASMKKSEEIRAAYHDPAIGIRRRYPLGALCIRNYIDSDGEPKK